MRANRSHRLPPAGARHRPLDLRWTSRRDPARICDGCRCPDAGGPDYRSDRAWRRDRYRLSYRDHRRAGCRGRHAGQHNGHCRSGEPDDHTRGYAGILGNRSQPGLCRSREPDDQQHLERADPVRREKLSGHGNDFRSCSKPRRSAHARNESDRRGSDGAAICRDQPARPLEFSHSTGRLRVTSTARTWTELS